MNKGNVILVCIPGENVTKDSPLYTKAEVFGLNNQRYFQISTSLWTST